MPKSQDYLTSFLKLGYSSKSQRRCSVNLLSPTSNNIFSEFLEIQLSDLKQQKVFLCAGRREGQSLCRKGTPWSSSPLGGENSRARQKKWQLRPGEGKRWVHPFQHSNHQIYLPAMETCKQKGNWDAPIKYSQVLFQFLSRMSTSGRSNKAGRSTDMTFTVKNECFGYVVWKDVPHGFHHPWRNLILIAAMGHRDSYIYFFASIKYTLYHLSFLLLLFNFQLLIQNWTPALLELFTHLIFLSKSPFKGSLD